MNLKLKYYLRGVGAGIIIATLILTIAGNVSPKKENVKSTGETTSSSPIYNPSTKESESSAKNEQSSKNEQTSENEKASTDEQHSDTENASNTENEEPSKEENTTAPNEEPSIYGGEERTVNIPSELNTSLAISMYLYEMGIVEDGRDFNTFLEQNGYDKNLHTGVKTIPSGATYEEIASILCK